MPAKLDITPEFKNAKAMQYQLLQMTRRLNREALKKIAGIVAEKAKDKVPVKTGRLRASIKGRVRKIRNGDGFQASVSTNTKGLEIFQSGYIYRVTKSGKKVLVGKDGAQGKKKSKSTYGYGLDVEIGRPSGKYKKTPYLRPALMESTDEIIEAYQDQAVQEAAKQPK